jgi:hypothetical protein
MEIKGDDFLRKILIFTLILFSFSSISYATVKTGGDYSAYSSNTRGDYPIEYINFYNYGQTKDSIRFQIDLYLAGPITRYGQDLSLRKHKLAIKTANNIYNTEFTDEESDNRIWGSFAFFSLSFKLPKDAVTAILTNDNITLVGYYPIGYYEYKVPLSTIKEWRTVINKGPVTYPNPIKL